ncbi:hypothetical protein JB92DRAFT_2931557 [Gautieria morchelliformis]|nr:hypothetical protein JB92DRAFT_2931557 [Gautieria morchelliformis]
MTSKARGWIAVSNSKAKSTRHGSGVGALAVEDLGILVCWVHSSSGIGCACSWGMEGEVVP